MICTMIGSWVRGRVLACNVFRILQNAPMSLHVPCASVFLRKHIFSVFTVGGEPVPLIFCNQIITTIKVIPDTDQSSLLKTFWYLLCLIQILISIKSSAGQISLKINSFMELFLIPKFLVALFPTLLASFHFFRVLLTIHLFHIFIGIQRRTNQPTDFLDSFSSSFKDSSVSILHWQFTKGR